MDVLLVVSIRWLLNVLVYQLNLISSQPKVDFTAARLRVMAEVILSSYQDLMEIVEWD